MDASVIMRGRHHGKTAAARRELAALRRDAAISLLLEAPAECSERAPLPDRCGKCWTCRIDKFLQDQGLRR